MLNLIPQHGRKTATDRVRPRLECLEERCTPTNSASFLGVDTLTQGSWMDHYGGTGYSIQGVGESLPSQDKITIRGASTYTYAGDPNDLRGLQQPGNSTAPRVEAGWFNYIYGTPTTGFDITLKLPGNQIDPVTPLSLYVEDWDGGNRSETIQPFDAQNGAPLADPVTVSSFRDGVYLNWNVKGNVTFHIEKLTGPSTEVSAVFLGGPFTTLPPGGAASAVGIDARTNGNWIGTYGSEGYQVYGALAHVPAYVSTMSMYGQSVGTYTFPMGPADARGLQDPASPDTHLSVAKYAQTNFTLDLAFNDTTTVHRVSFYVADLDRCNRSERFDVIDYNKGKGSGGAVLASQTVSDFGGTGKYVTFDISGHVQIRVTSLSSTNQNAVLEGIFFDPVPAGAAGFAFQASTATPTDNNGVPPGQVNFPPPAMLNGLGVDVVLLDRLFSSKGHHFDPASGD